MTKEKTIGDPLRPRPHWERKPVVLVSADMNAEGKQPKAKPYQTPTDHDGATMAAGSERV